MLKHRSLWRRFEKSRILFLIVGMFALRSFALANPGDAPYNDIENVVQASPAAGAQVNFVEQEMVIDFAIAPFGPEVFILIKDADARFNVLVWDIARPDQRKTWPVPADLIPQRLAMHPVQREFFLAGKQGAEHVIFKVAADQENWTATPIYRTSQEITHLLVGPRPFSWWTLSSKSTKDHPQYDAHQAYRVFLGVRNANGSEAIKSITEHGLREYQVLGPAEGYVPLSEPDVEEQPTKMIAPSAFPLDFHPAGDILLWQDAKGCFQAARYDSFNWVGTTPLDGSKIPCGGTITTTPNGLGFLHWQPAQPGVALYLKHGATSQPQAQTVTFQTAPRIVPDGKGLVGLTKTATGSALCYVPLEMPLADVTNAWMFVASGQDLTLFAEHSGLFRALEHDQLYNLYDTENYYPQYPRYATRPYFVTTDIFWEIFAAAYEGMFIVQEQQQAMPAFWDFVAATNQHYQQQRPDSPWAGVFATLQNFYDDAVGPANVKQEIAQIEKANGPTKSLILRRTANFGELKPRGHYTQTPASGKYFKGFTYLTRLAAQNDAWLSELAQLPPELKAKARAWIDSYTRFISLPRLPLVWQDTAFTSPYHKPRAAEQPQMQIFPLAWGFDNEVLLSTVYHPKWPAAEQITGPAGPRLIPSAIDIAAALGSQFAMHLLAAEFKKYPRLEAVLQDLQTRFQQPGQPAASDNSYDQWIQALAVQWANDVTSPGNVLDLKLWQAKRLQTGLASWTTLRHATVLVNERTGAEAGEGGFEEIIMQPPRGYVEPDPQTFEALAKLFDRAAENLAEPFLSIKTELAEWEQNAEPLRQGIRARLSDSASKARLFRDIAAKELRGEPLTPAEYEAILNVGRVAEHHFLVYKSLANARNDYALATPDPMPKVVDVAGGEPAGAPLLLSAVGRPLEWDQLVPYFGRREIVKGSVYSYYEFESKQLLNDQDWLTKLPAQKRPAWIMPFLTKSALTEAPKSAAPLAENPHEKP